MWARLARWNRGIANAIGSLIVSKSGGARRVETRDPTREFKALRRNSGVGGFGLGKLKVGRDRDRNGRGRLRIFFIYARADTKTSKVSGGKGRSFRVLFGRQSASDIMRIAREHSVSYADFSTVSTLTSQCSVLCEQLG